METLTTSPRGTFSRSLEARVITLDEKRPAYLRTAASLTELGCIFLPTPGVVWLDLPDEDPRKQMMKFEHGPTFTYGAAGVFLAHMEAWKEASLRNGPTMIFEDDACINVPVLRERLNNLPESYDVILLSPIRCKTDGLFPLPFGDMRFTSTSGYLVTPEGARKLLCCACKIRADGDGWTCVNEVSWLLPLHLERVRDMGAVVLADGTKPVTHDSNESTTRFVPNLSN